MASKTKIFGFTISLIWLAFITLAILMKSASVYLNDFFTKNSFILLISSSILLLILIITGIATFSSLTKREQ